jgi:hypothetical protein
MTFEEILSRLDGVRGTGGKFTARCPGHDDRNASLSISQADNGTVLLKCFAGCSFEGIAAAMGLSKADFFPKRGKGTSGSKNDGTVERLTVAKLAAWKKLDEKLLRDAGLRNAPNPYNGVIIPYFTVSGELGAVQYRLNTDREPRFRWASGTKTIIYGLDRLEAIKKVGWVLLFEGPSDCWTAWSYNLPALAVPSKTIWRKEWAADFAGIKVYLWVEPGADDLALRVAADIGDLYIIEAPEGIKDISQAHLESKDVLTLIEELKTTAIPAEELLISKKNYEQIKLRRKAGKVLGAQDPIEFIRKAIESLGYGGNLNAPLIIYLAATGRLLKMRRGSMPVHLMLLAVPSTGKSYAMIIVLCLLPPEAWHRIDAGSPRVLIYDDSELKHRVLIFDEIDSLPYGDDNPAASALRNLLQEHQLKYSTVVYNSQLHRWVTQQITKEGPTTLITTGIKRTDPQMDSRLFCVEVPEDFEQIQKALAMQAKIEIEGVAEPAEELIAFQGYLQTLAPLDCIVPFADQLAERIGKTARTSRVNRDFARIISLIKAVTIIRHMRRQKDKNGRLISTIADYATVYDLIRATYAAAATGASEGVRKVVQGVDDLRNGDCFTTVPLTVSAVAKQLRIGKASASRHVNVAIENGWLVNKSEKKQGKSYDLDIGEPLPDDDSGLPKPDSLDDCSTVSPDSGGDSGVVFDDGQLLEEPKPKPNGKTAWETTL